MHTSDTASPVAETALSLARALEMANPGELATMRRMKGDGGAPLFWRMAARHSEINRRPEDWTVIARILALLTPTGQPGQRGPLHDTTRPLGSVLCDGGNRNWPGAGPNRPILSELRLARLLAARGKARHVALERAARTLANYRPPGKLLNVPELAWAILNPSGGYIARDYYARLDRAASQDKEEDQHA